MVTVVLVRLGCSNKSIIDWVASTTNVDFSVLKSEKSSLKALADLVSGEDPLPIADSCLPAVFSHGLPRGYQCRRCKRCCFDPWAGKIPGGGNGNPLEYSSWRFPWTEESGGLQPMGSHRVRLD